MELPRRQRVEELFTAVQDYDVVLTPESPLADALNNRVTTGTLGYVAHTPRGYVLSHGGENLLDRKGLYLAIRDRTDLSHREALYLLENVLHCWEQTGDLHAITDYPRFDNDRVASIINILESEDNVFAAMADFTWDDESVVVIGSHKLTALDEAMLPDDYVTEPFLTTDTTTLPPFKMYDSATAIVETVRATIADTPIEDIAIVMTEDGPYQHLIEAALDRDDIPYFTEQQLLDQEDVRGVLQLMAHAATNRPLTVADIRPLLTLLDATIAETHDNKRIDHITVGDAPEIREALDRVEAGTVADAIDTYADLSDGMTDVLQQFRDELATASLLAEPVAGATVQRIRHYVNAFSITVDTDAGGVLLVSPTQAAYIDRPIVFYLGMGTDWARDIPGSEWVDRDSLDRAALTDFQALLQNGEQQHYFVQDRSMDERITPCLYFNDVLNREITAFTDDELPYERYGADTSRADTSFHHAESDIDLGQYRINTVSNSRLKLLDWSPKAYMFDKLLDTPKNEAMIKGSVVHDFAEFYTHHPDIVEEEGLPRFIDQMVDHLDPFTDLQDHARLRTELTHTALNLMDFIDQQEMADWDDHYIRNEWEPNIFTQTFDVSIPGDLTERWFDHPATGTRGKIDFLPDPTTLVDHKTGYRTRRTQFIKNTLPELRDSGDPPRYQPILYLTRHCHHRPDTELTFTLFYATQQNKQRAADNNPRVYPTTTIPYHPTSFATYLASDTGVDDIADQSKEKASLIDQIGRETFKQVFERNPLSREAALDIDELRDSAAGTALAEAAQSAGLAEEDVETLFKAIAGDYSGERWERFYQDDIDQFQDRLNTIIHQYNNEYLPNGFPRGDPDVTHRQFHYKDVIGHE